MQSFEGSMEYLKPTEHIFFPLSANYFMYHSWLRFD